ncbi:MAG: HEAT repeat domain-containing protein, partial [Acidobacteria bacterium]|nr:HEAT repeat domain-containing protein [Acidobacteriota bacterium]
MSRSDLENRVVSLGRLRAAPGSPETFEALRQALRDRNNYFVSKAAAMVAELQLQGLRRELLEAFERFLRDAARTDPKCWAKTAIIQALTALETGEPEAYLRGIRHVQREAAWGGQQDTAGPLRAASAIGLARSEMSGLDILTLLVDLLVDSDVRVRVDAVRAMEHLNLLECVPPLRLKALVGDGEAEVTGQCLHSLLGLDQERSVPFVRRFIGGGDENVRLEAIAALAMAPSSSAFAAVTELWGHTVDREVRQAVVRSLAASVLPEAEAFLLEAVMDSPAEVA